MTDTKTIRQLVVAAVSLAQEIDGVDHSNAIIEFNRWLAKVKAEAWDEGFAGGLGDGCSCDGCLKWVSNPYREETE